MLYISRYIGSNDYGVVDTDDGVEQRATHQELIRACEKLGLQIAGIQTYTHEFSWGTRTVVERLMTYQVPEMQTPLQVKTSVMRHVDVVVHKGMITNILWHADEITEPPVIRLSDYGDCCGDRILWGNANREVHKITLILDDKIKFRPKTFRLTAKEERWSVGKDGVGVMFDIRELTDNDLARFVYQACLIDEVVDSICFESIIDSKEREAYMRRILGGT